jgi:hypothetical protein
MDSNQKNCNSVDSILAPYGLLILRLAIRKNKYWKLFIAQKFIRSCSYLPTINALLIPPTTQLVVQLISLA